ncbi:MAG TPA: amino acid adenylation domain-containing protein, partial [Thermoanaerobaculia bacterium]|nr:amino acid adenylation domain-containing protein [Thermoanaerobaculia bacterium]
MMEAICSPEPQPILEQQGGDEVFLLPVSFAQQRLWFLSRLHPRSSAYNVSSAYLMRGALRIPVLEQAVGEVVRRHEILRTTFALSEGEPVQVVAAECRFSLPVVDLSGLSPEVRDVEAIRLVQAETDRPFDLLRGPLLRLLVLRRSEGEHVLFAGMHHIITDGWSETLLARELGTLYVAFLHGRPSPLPELPFQYGDFAQWQRDLLQGETLERLLAYWKRQLAGAPTVLDLPTDHPRPAVFSHRGAAEAFSTPVELTARMRELQEREGVTSFALLLAAFGVLLHRYSGQEDLLVGAPVANRPQVELEELIGLFVNTVVLRLRMSGNPGFRTLLRSTRDTVFEAQEHQDLLFERLISELDLDRAPSRNPLFQVVFAFQNTPSAEVGGSGLTLAPIPIPTRTAKFDLQLTLQEAGARFAGSLEYATDLFEPATLQRMAGHLLALLEGIVGNPEAGVDDLPLLAAGEREEILAWGGPAADPGPVFCLHEAFAAKAAAAPRAVAAVCEGEALTYGELHLRSDRLARYLQELGVAPETRVGIYLERSLDLVVAILGVLKAGGAYVPLDTAYPTERLAFMLEDSAAGIVLTGERLAPSLAGVPARIMALDVAWPEISRCEGAAVSAVRPENAAYVIYTSGSTGRPKGVVVPHSHVARLFNATRDGFCFGEDDVWTLFHSHAFDFSVWELWGALLHGGRLVVVPYLTSRSPELFAALLHREGVTVLNQTPSAFRALTLALEAGAPRPRDLRWVVFGGEALELQSLEPWWRLFDDRRPTLVNMYGITETTVHVTCRPLSRADFEAGSGSVIGRAIPDLELYVLDPRSRDVAPVGVPGEIHIGGAGLARGYLGRPELTAERFVPDPFSGRPGARLYRSGDLARWLPVGDLEYLGRADDQVKIRGFRIELGEIDAALRAHPAVRDLFVDVREDAPGERRLVAYVVAAGEPPSHEELRSFLQRRLPDYMIPTAFVHLASLPLTPHGKLDRRALPAPDRDRLRPEREHTAPRNPVEETIAEIWSETLGVDRIGIHDNFFTLGGDSIRSLKVVALARERGLDVPVHRLFQFPTVAGLAQEIAPLNGAESAAIRPFSLLSEEDRSKLPPGLEDAYPMARLQIGMLYHQAETPEAPLFHNVNSYHLRIPFDEQAFGRSVLRAVERHPILRTSFDLTSFSEPLQLVHRAASSPLEIKDIRHLSAADQETVLAAYWQQERSRSFDLAHTPQIRLRLHRRTEESFQFTLTENHAILDGWSLHTLYNEILTAYFALVTGEAPAELPPLQTTYRDFIRLEREALESQECQEFWRRKMEDCRPLRMPRLPGHRRDPRQPRVRRFDIPLPDELTAQLRRLATQEALPLKSVLLAAHFKAMSLLGGETDVLTSLSSNGRPETLDGDRALGLFLNTLPIRLRLSDGTWRDLVRQVYAEELEILPHRRYPLTAIQESWGSEPFLESSFAYLNFHVMADVVRSRGLETLGTGMFVEETNFPVMTTFQSGLTASTLIFNLDCDREVLTEPQIESLRDSYLAIVTEMACNPDGRYDMFSPLSGVARHQLLAEWNDARQAYALERPVHELFEIQAAARPDQPCLVFEESLLTFGEVNARANHLAHRLGALGLGPEKKATICLERSEQTVIALLAVLKAGAAYVPLDASHPRERLELLIQEAGAAAVVTSSRWAGKLAGCDRPLVLVDAATEEPEASGNPRSGVTPDHLAYVLFTSGSTGKPKGVAIGHRQLSNYLASVLAVLAPEPGASYALVSTFAADLGVTMIFGALTTGGCLHVISDERARDAEALAESCEQHPVDALKIVPSHLTALLDHREPARLLPRRWLVLGGEALDWGLAARLRELAPGCRVFNEYGPTEATVAVLVEELQEKDPLETASVPVGRPMGN